MRLILLIFIVMAAFIPAMGQVQRASISHHAHFSQNELTPIYEADAVDVQPDFPGGQRALINFINKVKEYPQQAYVNNVEGRVMCSVVINADGSVGDIYVVRGVEVSLDREAVRILRSMPNWHAGMLGGDKVSVRCFIPVVFRL